MSTVPEDRDHAGRLLKDLTGHQFIGFRMGCGVRVDLGGPGWCEINIEGSLRILLPGEPEWQGKPLSAEVATRLLRLLNTRITTVGLAPDSTLTISFDSRAHVIVPADDMYEAWQLRSDEGLLIVCTPGGGIAIWEP
ncbi:hypothetical protein GCM10027290_31230 [Micromonospora sonneratiae]|uniref:DUF6188 family protein n=1 Tax=Micromonospora sonneratiae TaxID=1184706 RepID=A0ABW3YC59_9ACTN